MFNPNRVNIHELTIDEPEKQSELPFDPERDITEEDWQGMEKKLEEYRQPTKWNCFAEQAMAMKILDPAKDLKLDQAAWQGMIDSLKSSELKLNFIGEFSTQAMQMKILDPTYDLNLDQAAWQKMRNWLEKFRQADWREFTSQAMAMKILDPTMDLKLDQAAWQGMRDDLEECRQDDYFSSFYYQAMRMKILDPKIDLNLNQGIWQKMIDELQESKQINSAYSFSIRAMQMKILAAEKVEVTDKGLEITMPTPKFISGVSPLPETKQF